MKAQRRRAYGTDFDVEDGLGSSDHDATASQSQKKKVPPSKKTKQKKSKATQMPVDQPNPKPSQKVETVGDRTSSKKRSGAATCNSILMRVGVPLSVRAKLARSLKNIKPQRRQLFCFAGLVLSIMTFALATSIALRASDEDSRFVDGISNGLSKASEELDHLGRVAAAAAGSGSTMFHLSSAHREQNLDLNSTDNAASAHIDHHSTSHDSDLSAPNVAVQPPIHNEPASDVRDQQTQSKYDSAPIPEHVKGAVAGQEAPPPETDNDKNAVVPGDGVTHADNHDSTQKIMEVPHAPDHVPAAVPIPARIGADREHLRTVSVGELPKSLPIDSSEGYRSHSHEQVHVLEYGQVMEIWGHEGTGSNPICRFHTACLGKNGVLLLPKNLKGQSSKMELCGIDNPAFILPDTASSVDALPAVLEGYSLDRETSALDLFLRSSLADTFSSSQPQFLQNVMAVLLAAETSFGSPESLNTYECINGTRSCRSRPSYKHFFPVTVLSPELAATKVDKESWTGSVLESLQSSEALDMSYFANDKLFRETDGPMKASCFHSVVSTELEGSELPAGLMNADEHSFMKLEALLSSGAVSKHMRNKSPDPNKCHLTFTVLQKAKSRELRNAYRLKTTLMSEGGAALKSAFPAADIKVVAQITNYETTVLEKMVANMRQTDVLIGPHSVGLSNSVFMMPHTTVIEVFPFGLILPTYQNLNKLREIKHFSVVAEPQTKTFKSCIQHVGSIEPAASAALFEAWDAAASEFKTGANLHALALEEPGKTTIDEAVPCALEQVLEFDVDEIAKKAVDEAVERCRSILAT